MNVGVIGTGWVASDRHIPAYKKADAANVIAVYDRDESRASRASRRFDVAKSFSDIDAFLDEPLDAVSICTPPDAHTEFIKRSLMAGKHVLVEKPFTLTSGDGRDLANLAEEQGLILAPAHNFLFARSTRRAKEIIDSGKAGELRSAAGVQLSSWRRRLPDWFDRLPGGLFFDESPHLIYLMREFIGELDVETAWTSSAGQDTPNPFEHTVAGLRGDKADGLLTVWSGAPFSEWYLALICTNSVLVIDLFRDTLVELPAEKGHNMRDVIRISLSGTMQHWAGTIGSGLRILAGRGSYGHNRLIEQFVAAVDGRSDPPTSAEDGWRTIQVIESVLHKANSAAAETGG